MRLPGPAAATALLLFTAVAAAQTAPEDLSTHASRHACLDARLSDLDQQMADHMTHYRAANPNAAHWEIKLERHSFSERNKADHQAEIMAARKACGLRHRPIS